jgi:hypothetical protein
MRADEEQLQALVGKDRIVRFLVRALPDEELQRRCDRRRDPRVSGNVDQPSPRRREQPRIGICWNPDAWPRLECCDQRIAERVLRSRDVAPRCRQVCEQAAVGPTGCQLGRAMRVDVDLTPLTW